MLKRMTGVITNLNAHWLSLILGGVPTKLYSQAHSRGLYFAVRHEPGDAWEVVVANGYDLFHRGDRALFPISLADDEDSWHGLMPEQVISATWSSVETGSTFILSRRDEETFSLRLVGEHPTPEEVELFTSFVTGGVKVYWPDPDRKGEAVSAVIRAAAEDGRATLFAKTKAIDPS